MTQSSAAPAAEETRLKADLAARFAALQTGGGLDGLHGLVALSHGRVVFEHYGHGPDHSWGRPLGDITFGPEVLHDLRSVTKSIVGLLYGIALGAGRVPKPDESLLAHFPDYADLGREPERARLTVAHALTMTLGTAWDESLPYSNPANSEIAMERAADRIRFVLDRPLIAPPGQTWVYNAGTSALLGRLIERGTGQDLLAFAEEALFAPLGITSAEWIRGRDGTASAASGLRLTPRSLARIGAMVAAGGQWNGRDIVPAAWIEACLRPAVAISDDLAYGYQWYLGGAEAPGRADGPKTRWVGAFGNGGQRLFVFQHIDFVLAVTAGRYDRPDQGRLPEALLRDVVLPSLGAR